MQGSESSSSSQSRYSDEQGKPVMMAAEEGRMLIANYDAQGDTSKRVISMMTSYLGVVARLTVASLFLVTIVICIMRLAELNWDPLPPTTRERPSSISTSHAEAEGGRVSHSPIMREPCGHTPEEATARGCHFDVISFCWLPDECYDAELSRDFETENSLEWFLDPNRTQPLTHDEIMTGQYTGLYVNWEYHVKHCTAMWKKMHRAIMGELGNRAIDGYIGVYEHTEHCEKMLLGGRDIALDLINTRIAVKYPDCGI